MNDNDSEQFHCKDLTGDMTSKHNKLNLEIPAKHFSDNQTPTPTRLLNKCEELRVFDDPYIQNLNPFDEGFRQAISNDHQPFLTTQPSQDTLHTPQILPEFNTSRKIQDVPENLSRTPEKIPKIVVSEVSSSCVTKPIPVLPKPSVIYAATPVLQLSSDASVKDKLKSVILGNEVKSEKQILPTILIATPILTTPASLIINNGSASGAKVKVKKEADEERREEKSGTRRKSDTTKVERNRAAARRYRCKMKAQGQAMKDKYEKALREVAQLRKEVTELKKLLLLHKDCEITRKMAS